MGSRGTRFIGAACLLLMVFALRRPDAAAASAADGAAPALADGEQPIQITARSSVDEELFALRLLADVYAHWPDLKGDRSRLRSWFSGAQRLAAIMRAHVRVQHLERDLETLFGDSIGYMSATESYLSNLDLLDQQNGTGVLSDVFSSLWDGLKSGSDVASRAGQLGYSDETAATAGKVAGAASALSNQLRRSVDRDAGYRARIAEEARKLEERWNETWGNLQATARKLTIKHGWAPGEAGFDGFQGAAVTDYITRSPRDPFLRARYAEGLMTDGATKDQYLLALGAYLEAAQLVPADSVYDSLRLQYVTEATGAAVGAAAAESGRRGYGARPSTAPIALRLARTYLAMDQRDASGYGHMQLARALAFAGRYGEAARSVATAYDLHKEYGEDAYFCYRYAKLMSLTGQLSLVEPWIRQAYRNGYHDIGALRTDPDMEGYRSQRPQEFAQLAAVRWAWHIKYGLMLDDLIVRNDSPFDLTNVRVRAHIRKGTATWDPVVTCAIIKAGSFCKGENVVSVTGDKFDEGSASFTSDQD